MNGPITPMQLRKLWATSHEVGRQQEGFDEETFRALVIERTGCRSLRALTAGQAGAVIDELERLLGHDPEAARASFRGERRRSRAAARAEGAEGAVTIFQVREIRELAGRLGWWTTIDGVDRVDEGRLRGFYARQTGHPSLVTVGDAQKVIEGLRAMLARAPRNEGGALRAPAGGEEKKETTDGRKASEGPGELEGGEGRSGGGGRRDVPHPAPLPRREGEETGAGIYGDGAGDEEFAEAVRALDELPESDLPF